MEEFFARFLPVFTSTLLGVLIAFWLNRRIEARGTRAARRARIERLRQALEAIIEAVEFNRGKLSQLEPRLRSGAASFDLEIDFSTWDVISPEVIGHLQNPSLQRRIAYYFSRVQSLVKLNDLLFSFSSGVASTLSTGGRSRERILKRMQTVCGQLIAESEFIHSKIEEAIQHRDVEEA